MRAVEGLLSLLVQAVLVVAPSVDGTQPEPATGFGSVAPSWLGTRVLPEDPATGYGEVRPTPPVMRHRRWTLPDDVRCPCRRDAAMPPGWSRRRPRA